MRSQHAVGSHVQEQCTHAKQMHGRPSYRPKLPPLRVGGWTPPSGEPRSAALHGPLRTAFHGAAPPRIARLPRRPCASAGHPRSPPPCARRFALHALGPSPAKPSPRAALTVAPRPGTNFLGALRLSRVGASPPRPDQRRMALCSAQCRPLARRHRRLDAAAPSGCVRRIRSRPPRPGGC